MERRDKISDQEWAGGVGPVAEQKLVGAAQTGDRRAWAAASVAWKPLAAQAVARGSLMWPHCFGFEGFKAVRIITILKCCMALHIKSRFHTS